MNSEENKLPEGCEVEESLPVADKKKLPLGALIGIIAGAALLLVALILILTLSGGEKCKGHLDKDDNLKCDLCGADFNDGMENQGETETDDNLVDITLTVKDEKGNPLAAVEIHLVYDESKYTMITDENSVVTHSVKVGEYYLEYNYDTIPEGFFQKDFSVNVQPDSTTFELGFMDNNPDGTEGKPFYISESETELVIESGQEIYYNYRGAIEKNLVIRSNDLSVTYNGEIYQPVDGVISFYIVPEIGVSTVFSVKNNSSVTVSEVLELISPLGSMDNPIALSGNAVSVNLPAEAILYYSWTVNKSGVLAVNLPDNSKKSVGISRILANDVPISSQTGEDNYAYMAVEKDDVITISVSNNAKKEVTVDFTLEIYAGTESEPVPVMTDYIDLSYVQGQRISFTAEAGKVITIRDEDSITVAYDGGTLAPEKGKISFTLTEGKTVFTVENTYEGINSVLVGLK